MISLRDKKMMCVIILFLILVKDSLCLKILAVFPYNGRSHHIFFSSLVEELSSSRKHNVTVINYFPVKKNPYLRQIFIQDSDNSSDSINVEDLINRLPSVFTNFYRAYDAALAFNYMANVNCKKLMGHKELQEIIASGELFDLVITEQFITDCGLALAYKLNAPTLGMTAHILMPWTYSRLGAPNNPAYVPNVLFNSGTTHIWDKIQNVIINMGLNLYYTHVIQKDNQEIVNRVYPDVPGLETLGRNMSLIMVNQYFPLTGSRLYGSNVVQVGGMHINQEVVELKDKGIKSFLDKAENGVVYISFGTVASYIPRNTLHSITKLIENMNMTFVWKNDNITDWIIPNNVLLNKWLPQPAILCHPNVIAFVSHSGMLSSTEAMHCGVPLVSVPLFGDQPTNAALAMDNGLGVTVDIRTLDEIVLQKALETVLHRRFQEKAKQLSRIWRDRPMSPMDTAVFWIEYVARHKGAVGMKPHTVEIHMYEYLLLDVYFIIGSFVAALSYLIVKILSYMFKMCKSVRLQKSKSD